MLFWEMLQSSWINEAQQDASAAVGISADTRQRMSQSAVNIDERFERLALLCSAMWSLLQEKEGVTDKELADRVTELDQRDGKLDGKIVKPAVRCRSCEAVVSRKFNRCLFCGEKYEEGDVFDTV